MGPYGGLQFNVTAGNGLPCLAANCQCYYAHTFPNVPLAAGQSIFTSISACASITVPLASAGSFGGVPGGAFCTWSGDTVLITIGSCPTNNDQADQPPCAGANGGCCGGGMPSWQVSEPYINLWLEDEPLGYQPSVGSRISFQLNYKQRETSVGFDPNTFSVGKKWNCSWLSYVAQDGNLNNVVYLPGGGQQTFWTRANNYQTYAQLAGNTSAGFTLSYPDGSEAVYGFIVTNNSGAFLKAFLTTTVNSHGQATTYNYFGYAPSSSPVIRLQSVIDGDGRTNLIYYNSSSAYSTNLISQVVDAFGHTNFLTYDNSGHLTNSIDVAGIPSSFAYNTNDVVTNYTTPYGTTSFVVTDGSGSTDSYNGRSLLVTQPDGGHQLFLYTNNAAGVAATYPSGQIPNTTPFANTFDTQDLELRDTFRWNPRQYADLSTTDIASFTANDFRKAHMKHWLQEAPGTAGNTISIERDPSPDVAGAMEVKRHGMIIITNPVWKPSGHSGRH